MASFSDALKKLQPPVEGEAAPRFSGAGQPSRTRFSDTMAAAADNVKTIPQVPILDPLTNQPIPQAQLDAEWREKQIARQAAEELSLFQRLTPRLQSAWDTLYQGHIGVPQATLESVDSTTAALLQGVGVPLDYFMRSAAGLTDSGTTILEESLISLGMDRRKAARLVGNTLTFLEVAGASIGASSPAMFSLREIGRASCRERV